jgi:hypothetical protein
VASMAARKAPPSTPRVTSLREDMMAVETSPTGISEYTGRHERM